MMEGRFRGIVLRFIIFIQFQYLKINKHFKLTLIFGNALAFFI